MEKRTSAFAAMLPMPLYLVSRAIASTTEPCTNLQGIRQIAQPLGTSYSPTLSHLTNLGYLDETVRAQLAEED